MTAIPSPTQRHALYRFFDATGALLYVGITNNPGRRWTEHQQRKTWWHEVARVDVEHHDGRAPALLAELAAIRAEHPRYNITGNAAPALAQSAFRVECDECDGAAFAFYVDGNELARFEKERKRLDDPTVPMAEKVVRLDELDSIPSPARWRACCALHIPDEATVGYWLDGITSRAAAVDALRHLGEKEWVGTSTGWASFAIRLLAPVEAALPRGQVW